MPNVDYLEEFFTNPYPNGWKDYPDESTMITASSLQAHTDAIEGIDGALNKSRKTFCPGYETDLGDVNRFIYFGSLSATLNDGVTTMGEVLGRSSIMDSFIIGPLRECSPYIFQKCFFISPGSVTVRSTPLNFVIANIANTVFVDSAGKDLGLLVGDHIINGGYGAKFINIVFGTGHDLSQRQPSYGGPSFSPRSTPDEYGNDTNYVPLGSMVTGHFSDLNFNRVSRQQGGMGWPLLVIGNGTGESARSNALELDNHGDMRLAGDLYFTTIGSLLTKISELESRISALEGGT